MDSKKTDDTTKKLPDRLRKSWIPLAAVAGAFTGFVSASLRTRPAPAAGKTGPSRSKNADTPSPAVAAAEPAEQFRSRYRLTSVLCEATSPHPFKHSLADITVGPDDAIYCLGDDEIRIFDAGGNLLSKWKVKSGTACLEAGPDGRVYTGSLGRVDIYSTLGENQGGMQVGNPNRPAAVTAIKIYRNEILVADASAKIIHRYNAAGQHLGVIGDKNKTGSFMLPNGWLDFDIDSSGIILATDTGRHRVTEWILDGTPTGSFGKFGMQDPSDFVGCCNPVNLAVTPDGNIVTAEKVIARVKVFNPEGTMIAYIGPENFDPNCTHIHLEVDSAGRIITADPVRRVIQIFSPVVEKNAAD